MAPGPDRLTRAGDWAVEGGQGNWSGAEGNWSGWVGNWSGPSTQGGPGCL